MVALSAEEEVVLGPRKLQSARPPYVIVEEILFHQQAVLILCAELIEDTDGT